MTKKELKTLRKQVHEHCFTEVLPLCMYVMMLRDIEMVFNYDDEMTKAVLDGEEHLLPEQLVDYMLMEDDLEVFVPQEVEVLPPVAPVAAPVQAPVPKPIFLPKPAPVFLPRAVETEPEEISLRKVYKRRKLMKLLKESGYGIRTGHGGHDKMVHEGEGTKPMMIKRHGEYGRGLRRTLEEQLKVNQTKISDKV